MNKIILLLLTLSLCLFADEIYLGMVHGIKGDSLILADGLRIYVPNARSSLVYENAFTDAENVSFPFTASLIRDRLSRSGTRTYVRIEQQYLLIEGRFVEKK
jgi:hypothetical protein